MNPLDSIKEDIPTQQSFGGISNPNLSSEELQQLKTKYEATGRSKSDKKWQSVVKALVSTIYDFLHQWQEQVM